MGVARRRRLVAQLGGLTLGIALHLVYLFFQRCMKKRVFFAD